MTKRRWRLWRRQRPRNRHTARSRRSIPASLWHRTHIMWDYVGHIKGVGHIYQQTVIDTYSKIGFAKLYDRKNALVAADMLNDRVVPFFEQHDLRVMRMLTDRGTEYCGNRETHEFELYLAIEDIDHSKIKAKSPQTNGICERFNRTVQNEFYAIAFRKKIYTSIDQLQADLDAWMNHYNAERTHSGKYCFGKTPMQTFIEGIAVARRYDIQQQGLHSQEGETQNISTSCANDPK